MIKGIIFDLDGVIVSTDEYHYQGWQQLADEEGIEFNREINERLRGVSRMESLGILLEKATKEYSEEEKIEMATRKNNIYRNLLKNITPADILPGVMDLLNELKKKGIKMAIGSSSKNTPVILERIRMDTFFDAVADGNDIRNSKPDPEVFLLAATRLSIPAEECLVVEDAEAGVSAALNARMKVLAVGSASKDKRAHLRAADLTEVTAEELLMMN
ncbi:MAG: beta-phosphoglucomutase [Bacteroidales bacterium]|nr:beta-phosphoglucomutase [Bacteroidales bacterium]